jgi:hypothetical protein
VFGEPAGIARPLVVRDLSPGGFSVESPVPFLTGTRHRFNFVAGKTRVEIEGVAIQSTPFPADGRADGYLAGFSFVIDSAERRAQIYELLDAVFLPSR